MSAGALAKLRTSLRRDGLKGTIARAANRIRYELQELTPSRRAAMSAKARRDRAFDAALGVDTGGVVRLETLTIASRRRERGAPYWAVDPDELADALRGLGVRYEEFTFVDLGSGKGRALLLAAELPFKKIVGVEFAVELHRVAERNVHASRGPARQRDRIELLCLDAADYALPDEPLVLYLYHPFEREVMDQIIANVRRSHEGCPRDLVVVYFNPKLHALWAGAGFLRTVHLDGNYAAYRTVSAG
jgi:SAM-dependent methyltransferase